MQIHNKHLLVVFLILCLVAGYTIFNINTNFYPSYQKCENGIKVINMCGCFPDSGIAKLFGKQKFEVNVTNIGNG